jgi:hypothetical protein
VRSRLALAPGPAVIVFVCFDLVNAVDRSPRSLRGSVVDRRRVSLARRSREPRSSLRRPERRSTWQRSRGDRDPPLHGRGDRGGARRSAPPDRGDPLARTRDRRGSVAGRAARDDAAARALGGRIDFCMFRERLNALPQFMTEIDGLDIHFIHVKSPHEDALPLIIYRRRATGPSRPIPTSSTSTKSTKATTSQPGRSRTSTRPSCEPRSAHCATDVVVSSPTETRR